MTAARFQSGAPHFQTPRPPAVIVPNFSWDRPSSGMPSLLLARAGCIRPVGLHPRSALMMTGGETGHTGSTA
jgi:hypothetical protein